jgi:putative transposase
LAKSVRRISPEIPERYEFEINIMEVKHDHVHLFLSIPPRCSPAGIAQIIKSTPGKVVFRQFPEVKEQLWSEGYSIRSVGEKFACEGIRRYIKCHQQEHMGFEF